MGGGERPVAEGVQAEKGGLWVERAHRRLRHQTGEDRGVLWSCDLTKAM